MALFSKKEFANRYGIETKHLSTYIDRGKIVLTGDLIDDAQESNASFLKRREGKKPKAVRKEKPAVIKPEKVITPKAPKVAKVVDDLYSKEKNFKDVQTRKMQREENILAFKERRLLGELLPTDVVKPFISLSIESIKVAFKQKIDMIILRITTKTKMTRNEIAELKGEIIKDLNDCIVQGAASARHGIKSIIDEYSQKE